ATVLGVAPGAVRHVTVTAGDRRVELAHADGFWTPGAGASRVTVGLLSDAESRLFPLQAYRTLRADTSSAEYGLAEPELTFSVEDTDGKEHAVALGAPTFTNGGVYAERREEPGRVYLVPRRMMDDLRSLVTGQRIDTPDDLAKKMQQSAPKDDGASWWLRQVLDSGPPEPGGAK
ncbi:MAG TPA: DUF4340 domain-containing protein, partial [Acidimicrobiia bacterium]|nr:DUF4340 domain-containing protein [Acidimicrobiia bacterium]